MVRKQITTVRRVLRKKKKNIQKKKQMRNSFGLYKKGKKKEYSFGYNL